MLLVLIVVSLGYLFTQQSSGSKRYLYGSHEFSRDDIMAMQNAFGVANLDDYEFVGGRVRVPARRFNDYIQALDKAKFDYAGSDSDIADAEGQGGFFRSSDDKKWVRGELKARELKRTLEKFEEIEWATVRFTETKEPGVFPPKVRRACHSHPLEHGRETAQPQHHAACSGEHRRLVQC